MSLTLDSNEVIDRQLWADIATVPDRPLRALVARRLVRRALKTLPLRVVTADGRQFGAGGPGDPVLRLVRPDAFYQRLGAGGLIGFGEAFMAGDWRNWCRRYCNASAASPCTRAQAPTETPSTVPARIFIATMTSPMSCFRSFSTPR